MTREIGYDLAPPVFRRFIDSIRSQLHIFRRRQSFNGPAVLLLAMARVLHLLVLLALPVLLTVALRFLLLSALHMTHIGGAPSATCPPPSSWLQSLLSSLPLDRVWCLVPPCPDTVYGWLRRCAPLGVAWSTLWPTLCPWEPYVWYISGALTCLTSVLLHFYHKVWMCGLAMDATQVA